MVTPRIFSTFSRDMPGSGCGSVSAILCLEFQRHSDLTVFSKWRPSAILDLWGRLVVSIVVRKMVEIDAIVLLL